jgi:uncharacterized membrane protein YeaQ/YmgE (transglycosylase-associated protein family)
VGILAWVLFGLVVGALARLVTPGKAPSGCIPTIAIGIVGALIGGAIASGLGGEGVTGFNLWSFLVAGLGAVILLVIYGAIAGRRQAR